MESNNQIEPHNITNSKTNDTMHGITLEMILKALVKHHGWEKLGTLLKINCFNSDPSIKSSLTFLRKTPWARKKVEAIYLDTLGKKQKEG